MAPGFINFEFLSRLSNPCHHMASYNEIVNCYYVTLCNHIELLIYTAFQKYVPQYGKLVSAVVEKTSK